MMYSEGIGTTKNAKEAARWVRKAAQQGFAEAQYVMGLMYAHGEGVTSNASLAYAYLSLASLSGLEEAQKDLERLTEILTEQQISQGKQLAATMQNKIKGRQ